MLTDADVVVAGEWVKLLDRLAEVMRERDEARMALARANAVISLASDAMNYLGDKANDADIVTDEDMAETEAAFEAVQKWQDERKL